MLDQNEFDFKAATIRQRMRLKSLIDEAFDVDLMDDEQTDRVMNLWVQLGGRIKELGRMWEEVQHQTVGQDPNKRCLCTADELLDAYKKVVFLMIDARNILYWLRNQYVE